MSADARPAAGRGIARNTVVFSIATALSRVVGLAREILASAYFATSGAFSAFTIAFQVPNLVRSLFADAALSAAFVPVFTELLEEGRRREAFTLAANLLLVITAALGAVSALFIAAAPWVMPLFTGDEFGPRLDELTSGMAQVMFPIVVLLGVNGLFVGILNAYDHFSVPAFSPVVWNLVIIGFLIGARGWFDGGEQLYAYAIGIVAGTIVQLAMAVPVLRRLDFGFRWRVSLRDPRLRRVLILMLPVTIGLGLINFNLLINSILGSLVSEEAPRAIDAAFRVYMLPQGMFSVAIATVLFPALSRLAARRDRDGLRDLMGSGIRQIFLLLIPAAACTLVLAEPITRLIYEHGEFGPRSTDLVAEALFWFSLSLPFSGVNLLLTRTFFSLQRPWVPTALAGVSLAVNAAVSVALYAPFGIAGIVVGTAAGSIATTVLQARWLRRELGGRLGARRIAVAVLWMLGAAGALAGVTWVTWWGLDGLFGDGLAGQAISVGVALAAGLAVYAGGLLLVRLPEALRLKAMVAGRLGRG